MEDPLSVGAKVGVMGAGLTVSGKDLAKGAKSGASFAKRHAKNVDVQRTSDGGVSVNYRKKPPRSRDASSSSYAGGRREDWEIVQGSPKRYIRMGGHKGVQASRMGIYEEMPDSAIDGYTTYKHVTGDWYLYYYKQNKFWFIGSRIGKRSGWLYVQSEERYPDNVNKSWRYWDDAEKKWVLDSELYCVHVTESEGRQLAGKAAAAGGAASGSSKGKEKSKRDSKSHKKRPSHSGEVVMSLEDSIFAGSKLENTWFAALFQLYGMCDKNGNNENNNSDGMIAT